MFYVMGEKIMCSDNRFCHWIGTADSQVANYLEAKGFKIIQVEPASLTDFKPDILSFYVIRSNANPTASQSKLLCSDSRKGNTVVVWTDNDHDEAWQKIGVELVLSRGFDQKFTHFLDFAINIHEDRVRWKDSEEKYLRSSDDLQDRKSVV